ncbi:MAG: GMP synthase [Bacteroidetes bacterium]|nr:MAG: GMP synthase [Bacteroidota bacterium]
MRMERKIRVAILDLYEGQSNQGMRCLREILTQYAADNQLLVEWEEFDVRRKMQIPDLSFDIFISTGGPGSPLESEGNEWEKLYFTWLEEVQAHNRSIHNSDKKYVFLICHSFQLVCRYYKVAAVTKRKSTAFGIFPVHLQAQGVKEPVFIGLRDPFYAVDSRDYQAIQPDQTRLRKMGAHVLAIEKERPHVPLERAIMAIRFNKYILGTQFHPEADPTGMSMYLQRDDKKKTVIAEHGEKKWRSMIEHLNDPDKIRSTYAHIIPNFINLAVENLHKVEV